ncbi:hypothetical protein MMC30_005971 [Trapelia coarctata]|nr:hypothetical protein [Trapelia coarctata]
MALALRSAAPLKPRVQLEQALSEFESILTEEQKEELRSYRGKLPSATAAMVLTAEIDRETSRRRSRCVGPRLTSLLESVQQFSTIVDTFVSGSQSVVAGLVWGGVKVALLTASNFSSYFDKLTALFMDIGRSCPRYSDFGSLYPSSSGLQTALCEYYAVVIQLCRQAILSTRKHFLSQLSSSLLKPFEADFGTFQKDLQKLGDAIRDETFLASQNAQLQESRLQAYERQEASTYRTLESKIRYKREQELEEARKRRRRKRRFQLLDGLSTHDHRIAWKQARKQGTSSWLFTDPSFELWSSSSQSSVLWCIGKLGSGKTVLSANVIEQLMVHESPNHSVSYFLFRFDQAVSSRAILGSLARQLLESLPSDSAGDEAYVETESPTDQRQIVKLLQKVLPDTRKYFVVLDGLDECDKGEARILMSHLLELLSSPRQVFKIYCSSRPDIVQWASNGISDITYVSMSSAAVNTEIAQFVRSSLERCLEENLLQLGSPALIHTIEDALLEGAQGMFLWVAFQIQDLCQQQSDEEIVNALHDLPKSLPEVFDRIIQRLKNPDPKRAQRIFKWIATARRPLTLEELREAICVEPCQTALVAARMVNNMHQALACCGSLVTIDEEQCTVHFAHHSIKQHLISKATEGTMAQYHLSMPEAEIEAGEICVTYLNFSMFDRRIRKIPQPGLDSVAYPAQFVKQTLPQTNLAAKIALSYLRDRKFSSTAVHRQLEDTAEASSSQVNRPYAAFLEYAREFWLVHTRRIPKESTEIWRLWSRLIDNDNDTHNKPWTTLDWETLSSKVIQFVADNDHEVLLRHTLARDEFQNIYKSLRSSGTPLHLALLEKWWESSSARKFRLIAKTLFGMNQRNLLGILLETPKLQILQNELFIPIVTSGDVELLIRNLAQGGSWDFEIHRRWALEYGLTLLQGGHVDAYGGGVSFHWTPLMLAVELGQTELVQYMLSLSPDSARLGETLFNWDLNPHFILAVMRNHKDIALLLLQSDRVEPNQSTGEGWTPLFYAAHKGYSDVAAYLVRMGGNVLHRAKDGRSAEDVARAAGHSNPHRSFLNSQALLDPFFPATRSEAAAAGTVNLDATIGIPSADAFVPIHKHTKTGKRWVCHVCKETINPVDAEGQCPKCKHIRRACCSTVYP